MRAGLKSAFRRLGCGLGLPGRTDSAYGGYNAPGVREHNVSERATFIEKRAGFVGSLDRDAHNQIAIADSGQAGLQGARIIQGCPLAIAVKETVSPFVRWQVIVVP